MTYASLKRTQMQTDLLAVDLLPECPNCSELCPAGATVCECGTHLFVRSTDQEAAFWAKVEKTDGCWQWAGPTMRQGYGYISRNGRIVYAHRHAYELLVGPIPDGLVIDHLCRNTSCVNPAHLEPVTQRENVLRGNAPAAKNAVKTHCPRGHEYTPENTITRDRDGRISRQCRECKNEWNRDYIAGKKTTGPAREPLDEDSAQGQEVNMVSAPIGCTCGGQNVCTVCVLAEYDGGGRS